eukprot:CAMPEP_0168509660 /NCGR_PEP_ID=MMETSP0405-20121227/930_1 /TAXON_ID=498012 /ORGANISM="Trichosphaerium sp, Strain Am-I-7 wt" /LENGTH=419 /DNA_ID=CAMNT_0008527205 /DNA_START=125 /DNA_END=1381 /DNA_ORIENTATION=-
MDKDNTPEDTTKDGYDVKDILTWPAWRVVHPTERNSNKFFLKMLMEIFSSAAKVYTPIYAISTYFSNGRKIDVKYAKEVIIATLRSSSMITVNTVCFGWLTCKLLEYVKEHRPIYYLSCALASSYSGIMIEKQSRRGALASYVGNITLETIWRMARARELVAPFTGGLTLLFASAMSILYYLFTQEPQYAKPISFVLRILVGEEGKQSALERTIGGLLFGATYTNHWTKYHVLVGFIRNFAFGVLIKLLVVVIGYILKRRSAKPDEPIKSFTQQLKESAGETFKIGLFLATLIGANRLTAVVMRSIDGGKRPSHALVAGFISGLSMAIWQSTSIATYFTAKAIESVFSLAVGKGLISSPANIGALVWAACVSLNLYGMTFEPHTVRGSFKNFVHRATGNRVKHLEELSVHLRKVNNIPE